MSGKEIHTKETFQVLGMSCAVCALNVETTLGAQEGVYEAKVNFAGSTVLVDYNPRVITPVELQKAVESAGYELVVENTEDTDQADRLQREEFLALKRKTIGAIVLAVPVFVIGMFFMHMPYGNWIMLAFTIPVMAFFGRDFFVHAYMQLKHGRANMDTLVAVSTGVAFLFSLFNTIWPEYWTSRGLEAHVYYEAAAVIIALILLGRLLEAKAKFSTSTAIKKLMGLQPKTVTKILADGSEEEVPIREVEVGDVLVVKPGEKIPVDGEVTEGSSFVDESMITGESIPVEKVKGQPVYAGTINEKGSFRFRADKVGGETVLANIIRMVQEAQGSKAPVQKLVDRIAGIFVPVVMGIAVITFIVWMLIGGDLAFTHALLTSITVLVIACPCALGLATPTAIMVGIGKGAEHNILIKDAESLELMYRVNAIVLDKTGTITEGKPVVTDIHWTPGAEDERYQSILLEIERRSEHPLADAVVQKFKEKVVNEILVSDFENQTGKGVTAKVGDKVYLVGNRALLEVNHVVLDDDNEKLAVRWEGDGKTVVFFAGGGRVLALVAIADKIKESSRQAVATLHEKGIDVLTDAIKILKKKYKNLELHVVGAYDENYKEKMKTWEQNDIVIYHGEQKNVHPFMKDCHALIHPSFYLEGMSNVCLEAAATGRPVITTDMPGCRDTIENGKTGFICQPDNLNSLVNSIEKFLKLSHDEKISMGLAGRRRMEKYFDRNIVVNHYMDEIRKINNKK